MPESSSVFNNIAIFGCILGSRPGHWRITHCIFQTKREDFSFDFEAVNQTAKLKQFFEM